MRRTLHHLCLIGVFVSLFNGLQGAEKSRISPYEVDDFAVASGKIDDLVFGSLRKAGLTPARPCSDEVFVRRVFLDVLGMLPEAGEARAFLQDKRSDKRMVLIDSLLARDEYVDYWSMKWCDLLRVKSEFPINLWPNAVQAYERWIRDALGSNMPYDRMARELLTSSGSNFRVPQVNFFRAVQGRGPQPVSDAVALTFMGSRIEKWPEDRRRGIESLFSRLKYKPTAEWKEEVVCLDPAPTGPLETILPDGRKVKVSPGDDPRVAFANWLMEPGNRWFSRAAVNRTWAWVFGRGIVHEADDIRVDNPPCVAGLLEYLEKEFVENGYDQKKLLRLILSSRVYQLSPVPSCDDPRAEAMFASYPVRRLEAEVLQDALCQLTGTVEGYDSPIPEPFTRIPASARSVNLADASITSSFLEMFGRSQRDSGMLMERNNRVSSAQRLYLLNSSQIQSKIERSWRLKTLVRDHRGGVADLVSAIWMEVLSRSPLPEELRAVVAEGIPSKSGNKEMIDDLVWALINSKEFLYRH